MSIYTRKGVLTCLQSNVVKKVGVDILFKYIKECGGTVVRTPGLESQGCEFDSHCVSTLATLGKLLT